MTYRGVIEDMIYEREQEVNAMRALLGQSLPPEPPPNVPVDHELAWESEEGFREEYLPLAAGPSVHVEVVVTRGTIESGRREYPLLHIYGDGLLLGVSYRTKSQRFVVVQNDQEQEYGSVEEFNVRRLLTTAKPKLQLHWGTEKVLHHFYYPPPTHWRVDLEVTENR